MSEKVADYKQLYQMSEEKIEKLTIELEEEKMRRITTESELFRCKTAFQMLVKEIKS